MRPHLLLFSLVLLLFSAVATADDRQWTNTEPPINATHVFLGEINRRGKPTGFHAKLNGQVHKDARIIRIQSKPNQAGVYTAQVAIRDPNTGEWKEKFSSMFPDDLDVKTIIKAIEHAYQNRDKSRDQPWQGPSGHGFPIEGYTLNDGRINTAYPIYIRDQKS